MFLTTHASAGFLLGTVFQNPVLSFSAGMLSHIMMDMIPHDRKDEHVRDYPKDKLPEKKMLKYRTKVSLLDSAIVLIIIWYGWYFNTNNLNNTGFPLSIYAGIFGGLLPDVITSLVFFYDNRLLRIYHKFHLNIHFVISKLSVPRKISITYQFCLSILLIYLSHQII
ncbi:hypothetical protein ACFL7D_04450 [candidate division KSB1 bacterium]